MGLCFPRSMCSDFLPFLAQCESREMCKRIALIETLGNIFIQFFSMLSEFAKEGIRRTFFSTKQSY